MIINKLHPHIFQKDAFKRWIEKNAEFYKLEEIECHCGHTNHYHYPNNLKSIKIDKSGCLLCKCTDFKESFSAIGEQIRDENTSKDIKHNDDKKSSI